MNRRSFLQSLLGAVAAWFAPKPALGAPIGRTIFKGELKLSTLLRGSSEFRRLSIPYVIRPGVPIGLFVTAPDPNRHEEKTPLHLETKTRAPEPSTPPPRAVWRGTAASLSSIVAQRTSGPLVLR